MNTFFAVFLFVSAAYGIYSAFRWGIIGPFKLWLRPWSIAAVFAVCYGIVTLIGWPELVRAVVLIPVSLTIGFTAATAFVIVLGLSVNN